ncbi:MAG TPA: glycosyltransferase, partial [Flavobacteriales bacterium]|nr:glycosyltransferase [Flavobacteriales bacterium]
HPRGLEHFGLQEGKPILFVTGGSLGARGVNRGIEAALKDFQAAGIQVIWQTGTPYLQQAQDAVAKLNYTDCRCMSSLVRWTTPTPLPTLSWHGQVPLA